MAFVAVLMIQISINNYKWSKKQKKSICYEMVA